MKLQNVDASVYAKAADAVASGKYKLVYEKSGRVYGSKSGIPAANDYCFNKSNKATKAAKHEAKKATEVKEPVIEKHVQEEPVASIVETHAEPVVEASVEQIPEVKE